MRLTATPLLAALALLLTTSSAQAYRVDLSAELNGNPYTGQALNIGDQLEVLVSLDTENAGAITLVGVGVLFDSASFTYRPDLSSATSYLLYTNAKSAYLVPDPSCVGSCDIYPTRSNQMQVGFLSNKLPGGVPGTTQTDLSVAGGPVLHRGVFEVTSTTAGTASFTFDFDEFYGSILQLDPPSNPPLTLGPDLVVTLPEPSIGLLSLVAIGTVAAVRRRRHRA